MKPLISLADEYFAELENASVSYTPGTFKGIEAFLDTSVVRYLPLFLPQSESDRQKYNSVCSAILFEYYKKNARDQDINPAHLAIRRQSVDCHRAFYKFINEFNVALGPTAALELREQIEVAKDINSQIKSTIQIKQSRLPIPYMHRDNTNVTRFLRANHNYKHKERKGLDDMKIVSRLMEDFFGEDVKYMKNILRITENKRAMIEDMVGKHLGEYGFFLHFFGESAKRLRVKKSGRKDGRVLDHKVIAEAAVYSLINDSPARIITGDKDFSEIVKNSYHDSHTYFQVNKGLLKNRNFEITILYKTNPTHHNPTVEFIPVAQLGYIEKEFQFNDIHALRELYSKDIHSVKDPHTGDE